MGGGAWSPDGQFVLSSGDDSCLKIWQVELGVLSAEFEIGDKVMSLSAAPDGSLAAVVLGSGAVKVIDFETGAESSLGQYPSGVSALSWSFDGRYLAAGTARQILIWDWEEQKLVQSINAENEILALGWGRKSYLYAATHYAANRANLRCTQVTASLQFARPPETMNDPIQRKAQLRWHHRPEDLV